MKYFLCAATALLAFTTLSYTASAEQHVESAIEKSADVVNEEAVASPTITIRTPYAFATSELQKNGAVFLTVKNYTNDADKLIGASSDIAERTEMHTSTMEGGMMQMRTVESYDALPRSALTLEPTGHHIMLLGLQKQLTVGETFPVTLTFEKNGEKKVDVRVIAPGTSPKRVKTETPDAGAEVLSKDEIKEVSADHETSHDEHH